MVIFERWRNKTITQKKTQSTFLTQRGYMHPVRNGTFPRIQFEKNVPNDQLTSDASVSGKWNPRLHAPKRPLLVEIMKNHPLPRIPKTVIPKTRGIVNGFCLAVPGKWQVLSEITKLGSTHYRQPFLTPSFPLVPSVTV